MIDITTHSNDQIAAMQDYLNSIGYEAGPVDNDADNSNRPNRLQ